MTIVALNYWPWEWSVDPASETDDDDDDDDQTTEEEEQREEDYVHVDKGSPRVSETSTAAPATEQSHYHTSLWDLILDKLDLRSPLRICLLSAALACILRPTNIMIWLCLLYYVCVRTKTYGHFMETRWIGSPVWVNITTLELLPYTQQERRTLFREGIICG